MRAPSILQPRASQTSRARRLGLALSIAAHFLVLALALIRLRGDFTRVWSAGDAALRPANDGGGGGREAYISLAAPRVASSRPVPLRATPPPVAVAPTPPKELPPPDPDSLQPEPALTNPAEGGATLTGTGDPGTGGGNGGGVGTGNGPGTGAGTGPGAGDGGQGRPPQLRHQVFYLEKTPKELRGIPLRVTFSVDEVGRVARVAIQPPIRDRKFADGFRETMMQYRFRPALGPDGLPVAAEIELTFTY